MKVEKIEINKVIPYKSNAKIHTAKQIEQIKESIKQFGNNDPIAIDENNIIIEGNGRYLALKELGVKEIEVIRLLHLKEEEKKAYILIHNKLTMNTEFDLEILEKELSEIENIDMSTFNLEAQEIIEGLGVTDEDFIQ